MRRRTLLATIGSGAIALQAGCLAGGIGEPSPTDEPDDGTDEPDDGTDEPTEEDIQPEVVDHSVETTETGCRSDDDEERVDVSFDSDGVSIDGLVTTSNPCHEAVIESAAVDTGELRVALAFESTDDVCTECVGAIEYAATVEIDGMDGLDAVTVDHGEDGGSHTVQRDGSETED